MFSEDKKMDSYSDSLKRFANAGSTNMNRLTFAARNIADKLQRTARSKSAFEHYMRTYLLARIQSVSPDAYVISYPKCGRTWLRTFLTKYFQVSGHSAGNYHDRFLLKLPDQRIIKFDHDESSWVVSPREADELSIRPNKFSGKTIIFLVRDPRDVLVSSWYHLKFREHIYRDDLSTFVRDGLVGISKVVAFMNLWTNWGESNDRFLILTYENMKANPGLAFSAFLEHLSIDVDGDVLDLAINASSFQEMKSMELNELIAEPWLSPGVGVSENSMKIRRGEVGGFRRELSLKDIAYLDNFIAEKLSPELDFYKYLSQSVAKAPISPTMDLRNSQEKA